MVDKELIELTLKYSTLEPIGPTAIPQLQIARSFTKTQAIPSVYTPCLCFIVQGAKEVRIAEKHYQYNPSQYLVTSIDVPVIGGVTEATRKNPYLCLVLELQQSLIYEVVRDADPSMMTDGATKKGIFLDKVNPDLSESFLRLVRTLKSRNDMQFLAPLIIKEIIYRLLTSKYGDVVKQIGVAGSQTQRIAKVIGMIRRDFAKPLRVEELAEAANMSPSSFHQHFKQVTTLSPLQYQKQLRLQEARRLLVSEVADAATAAFQVGYESPSQFSREYARLFGLPPISDLKRLKLEKSS